MKEARHHCKDTGLDNNPVEVLRYFQSQLVQGRPLEIEDETLPTEGLTNQIFVDRSNLLETGFDEIEALDNKQITLEVQFYNEVTVKVSITYFFIIFFPECKHCTKTC